MTASSSLKKNGSQPALVRRVIYVGLDPAPIVASLAPLGEQITLRAEAHTAAVLLAAARQAVDTVIVDLSTPDDARLLLTSALAAAQRPPQLIILARSAHIADRLQLFGIHAIIGMPIMPKLLRDAVLKGEPSRSPAQSAAVEPASPAEPDWLVRRS